MWQMLGPKAPFFVPLIAGLVVTPLLWFKLGQAIKDTDLVRVSFQIESMVRCSGMVVQSVLLNLSIYGRPTHSQLPASISLAFGIFPRRFNPFSISFLPVLN